MLLRNKNLLLGAAGALALWLIVYFAVARNNWSDYAAKIREGDAASADWEKNYSQGKGLLPKDEADKALEENKNQLSKNLQTLQRIELGTPQVLHPYTVQAAGGGDPNNYFDQLRIKTVARATNEQHITLANATLGLTGDDPVPVKLLRLCIVDAFLNDCQKAGVARITNFKHYPIRVIYSEGDEADPAEDEAAVPHPPAKKGAPAKAGAAAGASRIVQFPMKVSIQAPEKSLGKLLFELQQPSDGSRGYLCVRGFSVAARDTSSGVADATVAVSGLLSEKYVREDLNIAMKGEEERPGQQRRVNLRDW